MTNINIYKIRELLDRRSDKVIIGLFAEFKAECPNPDACDIENLAFDVMLVQKEKRKIEASVYRFFGPKTEAEAARAIHDAKVAFAEAKCARKIAEINAKGF